MTGDLDAMLDNVATESWKAQKAERDRALVVVAQQPTQGEPPPASNPATGQEETILPAPSNPMAVARKLEPGITRGDDLVLRRWRGSWMRWHTTHWAEAEDAEIREWLYSEVEHAVYTDTTKKEPEVKKWAPNRYKLADLGDALAAICFLSNTTNPPSWVTQSRPSSADGLISVSNGILVLEERVLLEHNPRHFTLVSVPFPYDPRSPVPELWNWFLRELWGNDDEQIAVLQEWFGYVISGRTDLQKILLAVGPTRAGKGVIARVLTALIGKANVSGTTLNGLATNFGLQDLIGKPLCVISDARLGRSDVGVVVERLLSISGEDTLTVDRKYRDPWTGQFPTRLLMVTNELPRLGDSSAAIAGRFVPLLFNQSFLGREDKDLTKKLLAELPGILNWAIEGLDRITEQGRFTVSAAADDAVIALQDLASPIAAFIRDRCMIGGDVLCDDLWEAWKAWCIENGQSHSTRQTFGRNLRSRVPRLQTERPTGDDGTRHRRYVGISLRSES